MSKARNETRDQGLYRGSAQGGGTGKPLSRRRIRRATGEHALPEQQLSFDLRAAVVGESAATARAADPEQPQSWWEADRAMLDEHPPYRDKTKEERKALGAFADRISRAAVAAAEVFCSNWPEPLDWSFARLLTIHSFYAEMAGAAGMRVIPAYWGKLPMKAEIEMLEAIGTLPLELGPEHLGPVQETLMGYGLADGKVVPTNGRRHGGVFFTPYDLALKVTLRTLEPLLRIVPPEKTLDLRICDPAVGGGVFLIAAVRVLAPRVLRAGLARTLDEAKRLVAIHCCYGVDVTVPGSVTARLALTLECRADRMPNDWLEDNIKRGDSLVGLSLDQIAKFSWRPNDEGSEAIKKLVNRAMTEGAAARQARIELLSRAAC